MSRHLRVYLQMRSVILSFCLINEYDDDDDTIFCMQEAAGRSDKRPGEEARCSPRDSRQTAVSGAAAAS